MIAKTEDGYYIPYTPAQKIATTISYLLFLKGDNSIQFYSNMDAYMQQNLVAKYELQTPSYYLVNVGISSSINKGKVNYILTLAANNLFDLAYYDHLSRFKNYGLLNIGRNINLNFKLKFNEALIKSKETTTK